MSAPARYVEKVPSFTAVQWDGSDEAATWILGAVYAGSQRSGEELVVRDSMDRESILPRHSWVVQNEAAGLVNVLDDETFRRHYEPAD